ncbi:endonuclease/exonuclease/phosphatase family protein [Brevibacillus sp. SYSU BS000544]|uniref:endonuclease/exonuclease/phosphatase family protein n=1 Tax=Brevibacillus sp. SYSU BS000544 TaxID=3416443 RepID=UPI003CE4671C
MKKYLLISFLLLLTCSMYSNFTESSYVSSFYPSTVHSDSGTLSVATYNIRGCRNDEGLADVKAIADEIRELDPDILALQEVDEGLPRSGFVDQAKELSRLLQMNYAFSPTINFVVGAYGNAVLSKYPIQNVESIALPSSREPRGVMKVTVDANGSPVTLYTTHFGLKASERKQQADTLYQLLQKEQNTEPTILLGDFNVDQSDPLLAPFRKLLDDPLAKSKTKFVTIDGNSLKQIDHIFISDELALSYAKSSTNNRSDHSPVFFELHFATETAYESANYTKERRPSF